MIKAAPVAILNPRDKMPFEVTPFFPHLSRLSEAAATAPAANSTAAQNGTQAQ
jgi:hypothetical protein